MLWVTRSHIRVNRAATGWLVRRLVDPEACFRFVEPAQVSRVERENGALGFDAPGVRYPHKDRAGRCSFEALVEEHVPHDAVLRELARIVRYADFPQDLRMAQSRQRASRLGVFDTISLAGQDAEAAALDAVGLRTIARGFSLVAPDDHEALERSAFLYDALYASLGERLGQ
jgi:hypothetical protein